MNCGIYQIKHLASGRVYIGSSQNLRRRLNWHRTALKRGEHHSPKLQRAWDKYGEGAFEFSTVLFCSSDMRLIYEQLLIDGLNAVDGGWNCSVSAHCPVVPVTPQSRERMKTAQRAIARKYNFHGEKLCLVEIAERSGVPAKLLDRRVNELGWALDRALTEPVIEMGRELAAFGRKQGFGAWAKELGVNESTLRQAVRTGRTVEQFALAQKRLTVTELAGVLGMHWAVLSSRLRRGWNLSDAVNVVSGTFSRRQHMRNQPAGLREMAL